MRPLRLLDAAQPAHAQPALARRLACFSSARFPYVLPLYFWPSAGPGSQPCPRVVTCFCSPYTCAYLQAQVHPPAASLHRLSSTRPMARRHCRIQPQAPCTSLSSAMCHRVAANLGLIAGNVGNHDFCFGHPSASANVNPHQTGNFVPPNTHTTQTRLVTPSTRLSLPTLIVIA